MKKQKTSKPKKTAKHLSQETKDKISAALKGNVVPWNKNKKTGLTPSNKGKRWDARLKKYVSRRRKADKEAS